MRWIIEKSIADEVVPAVSWAKKFLAPFCARRLDWIRIDTGRGRLSGAYGRCWYPSGHGRKGKGYRISVQVPGPFPYWQRRYVKPLYRSGDGSWPPVPDGCEKSGWCRDERTSREWIRLTTRYEMRNRAEAVVHVLAHEFFHFLRHSRQIPGRNRENEADQFALAAVNGLRGESRRHGLAESAGDFETGA